MSEISELRRELLVRIGASLDKGTEYEWLREHLDILIAAAKEEERASIRVKAEWCGKSDELGNMVMVPASMLNPDKPKEADNDNS